MNELKLSKDIHELMKTGAQVRDLLDDMLMMSRDVEYELTSSLRRKGADDNTYEASKISYLVVSTLLELNGKMEELLLTINTFLWPCIMGK